MNQEYWGWKAEVPEETCDRIISENSSNLMEAVVSSPSGDGNCHHLSAVRKSKVNFNVSPECFELCSRYTHAANRQVYGVDITNQIECQFTMYDGNEEGFYGWHTDWGIDSSLAFDRKLSCIIVLSAPDEYEGGELQLGYDQELRKPEKGSVFVFPSFILHQVRPVTSGKRFSLVSWAEGPPWR